MLSEKLLLVPQFTKNRCLPPLDILVVLAEHIGNLFSIVGMEGSKLQGEREIGRQIDRQTNQKSEFFNVLMLCYCHAHKNRSSWC